MAACQRVLIAAAAAVLFALPYLRRAVVGTSCNAHASVVVANAPRSSVGTAMWLQNLARQFEGLELEL